MLRDLLKPVHAHEALWLAPFLCIGLITFGLLRPLPHFPPSVHSRTVVGADGVPVQIALPFRGVALAPGFFPNWYLEDTRSPELLVYAGNSSARKFFAGSVMSWIYPEVLLKSSLWGDKLFKSASPYTEIESLLAYDPGVYLGNGGPQNLMRRVGLPVLTSRGSGDFEDVYFSSLRVNSALIGHPELSALCIAAYRQAFSDLEQELHPTTLGSRPRVLIEGDERSFYPRAGVVDGARGRHSWSDPESLLAVDPDMIFLQRRDPHEFMQDPRWQGLRAVRDKRVYRLPGILEWAPGGMTFKPIEIRWMAELAHPERLRPRVRRLLRDRMIAQFGYQLSDEQIDQILHVEENSSSAGAERFTGELGLVKKQGATK